MIWTLFDDQNKQLTAKLGTPLEVGLLEGWWEGILELVGDTEGWLDGWEDNEGDCEGIDEGRLVLVGIWDGLDDGCDVIVGSVDGWDEGSLDEEGRSLPWIVGRNVLVGWDDG